MLRVLGPADDNEFEQTWLTVTQAERAYTQWKEAMTRRDEAIVALWLKHWYIGPTAVANRVGLSPSTIRAITRHIKTP